MLTIAFASALALVLVAVQLDSVFIAGIALCFRR